MKFLHCSCNQRIFVHSCHHWYIVYATTLDSSWWRSPNMKKGVSKSRFLAVLAGFTKEARQGRPPHWLSIWVAHGLTCQRLSADVIFDIKIFLGQISFFDIKASKIQNDSQQFTEERLETRSRTIIPWSVQSISQSPITRYNDPFFLFDLCLRPWWTHLTSQVPGHRSVFMLA